MKLQHWGYVGLLAIILMFAFLGHPPAARKEAPLVAVSTAPPAIPPVPTLPAPTIDEVQNAVSRVFGDKVIVQGDFFSADLNGDGSDDLVVPVRSRPGKQSQLTGELVNWTVHDVLAGDMPAPHTTVFTYQRKQPVRPHITSRDPLLVVIHGYGPMGWRNSEARQAYLLLHANWNKPSVSSIHDLEKSGASLPRLSANPTLALVTQRDDHRIAVYWTGAAYAVADIGERATLLAQK